MALGGPDIIPREALSLCPDHGVLRVCSGPGKGTQFRLQAERQVLGRPGEAPVDIDLSSCEKKGWHQIARQHAELRWSSGSLVIRDLGSANGTFVNGVRVPAGNSLAGSLKVGDRIQLATVEFTIDVKAF